MDTSSITEIYMRRPQTLACQGLGEWFCAACGIMDKELIYSSTREAKKLILERYIHIENLVDRLHHFNNLFNKD